jgi:hypothetical protein
VSTKNKHLRHRQLRSTWAQQVRCCKSRGGPFTTRSIYLKVLGLVEERHFNVSLFSLHNDMLIIFEKLISVNESNFKFINIEAARTRTSSMKILLFQWSQVSKHPKWKLMIDAWFERFMVSIKLNIFLC